MASDPTTRSRAATKRIAEARLKTTTPARLRKLADYPETHRRLARNPRTPVEVLQQLGRSRDPKIMRGLVTNRSTPARTLTAIAKRAIDEKMQLALVSVLNLPDGAANALAKSEHHQVKRRLAERPRLPIPAQLVLAQDHQNSIRWDIVENQNTAAEVLDLMSRDPDQGFAAVAAQHENVSPATLTRLAKQPDPIVRVRVASAANTSVSTLRKLLEDPSAEVRFNLVWRENCPRSLLMRALADSDASVRKRAATVLNERGLTPAVESLLSGSDDAWVRNMVAGKGSAIGAGRLADDPDTLVRRNAVKRGRLDKAAAIRAAESTDSKVLTALLANPHTLPMEVHALVVGHPDAGVRVALTQRRDYSREILRQLLGDTDCWVRRSAALNPMVTAAQLETLQADIDGRVRRLGYSQTAEGAASAEPDAIAARGEARAHATTEARQVELATHGDIATRINLARNTACCDAAQVVLASTVDGDVRFWLGKRKTLCPEAIEVLAAVDNDYGAHYGIANIRSLPESIRKRLVRSPHGSTRTRIADRPDLDDEDMALLALDASSEVRRELVWNKRTPASHLFTLAQPVDSYARIDIARHRRADDVVLDFLAMDPSSSNRYSVAKRAAKLSPLGKKRLAFDTSYNNRKLIAADPKADPELLDVLADDLAVAKTVATHKRVSQKTLLRLLDHPNWECRRSAFTRAKDLTDDQLRQGAADVSWLVRKAVAERVEAPTDVLDALAGDRSPGIRGAVARHENTSGDALASLAGDPASRVINGLLANPTTPSDVLLVLLPTVTNSQMYRLAMHPNLDAEGLRLLSQRDARGLRSTIARSERTPADVLTEFADHSDESVRGSVALNPTAPAELLRSLATDESSYVRGFVAQNPSTPTDVLAELADDPEDQVRRSLAHNPNASAADRVLGALL